MICVLSLLCKGYPDTLDRQCTYMYVSLCDWNPGGEGIPSERSKSTWWSRSGRRLRATVGIEASILSCTSHTYITGGNVIIISVCPLQYLTTILETLQ